MLLADHLLFNFRYWLTTFRHLLLLVDNSIVCHWLPSAHPPQSLLNSFSTAIFSLSISTVLGWPPSHSLLILADPPFMLYCYWMTSLSFSNAIGWPPLILYTSIGRHPYHSLLLLADRLLILHCYWLTSLSFSTAIGWPPWPISCMVRMVGPSRLLSRSPYQKIHFTVHVRTCNLRMYVLKEGICKYFNIQVFLNDIIWDYFKIHLESRK